MSPRPNYRGGVRSIRAKGLPLRTAIHCPRLRAPKRSLQASALCVGDPFVLDLRIAGAGSLERTLLNARHHVATVRINKIREAQLVRFQRGVEFAIGICLGE